MAKNGISKDLLLSLLNAKEYKLREFDKHAGVVFAINAMNSWAYEKDPIEALSFEEDLKYLRENIDKGIFEKYLEENILGSKNKLLLSASPKQGLYEEKEKELSKKIKDFKDSLSKEEFEKLKEETAALKLMQESEDTKENKMTIPKLKLSDVEKKGLKLPCEISREDGKTFLYHDIFTGKISYYDFSFDLGHISFDKLNYLSLLTSILGQIETKKYSLEELTEETFKATGYILFNPITYEDRLKDDDYKLRLNISSKVLGDDFEKGLDLILEIAKNSNLDDEKRIKEIIQMQKSRLESIIVSNGNSFMTSRAISEFSKTCRIDEELRGINYFYFLQDLENNFDLKKEEIIANLKEVYKNLFNKKDLVVNFTGSKKEFDKFKKLSKKLDIFEEFEEDNLRVEFSSRSNEAFNSSSSVNYVVKAAPVKKLGYKYTGKFEVLSNLISREFLYNEIRAIGGAYGTGISIGEKNSFLFSYRDPNLRKTIETYDKTYKFLENLELEDYELDSLIIGSISAFDPLLTKEQIGKLSLSMYLNNYDENLMDKYLEEAINTTVYDLKSYSKMLKDICEYNSLKVLGKKSDIEENKDLFDDIKDIILKKGDRWV